MKTNEKTLRELYKSGNKETRALLEKEYPALFKQTSILEQAIQYLTEEDNEVKKLRIFEGLEGFEQETAQQKIIVIVKWKNKGTYVDFTDGLYKFYPYFYMDKFRLCTWDYFNSISLVPARLCFKNEEAELLQEEEVLNYYKTMYQL